MHVTVAEYDEENVLIPLPFHVLEEIGWCAGDLLNVTKVDKTIHLTKIIEERV